MEFHLESSSVGSLVHQTSVAYTVDTCKYPQVYPLPQGFLEVRMKSRGDAQRGIYDNDEQVWQGLCHQHVAGQPCTIHLGMIPYAAFSKLALGPISLSANSLKISASGYDADCVHQGTKFFYQWFGFVSVQGPFNTEKENSETTSAMSANADLDECLQKEQFEAAMGWVSEEEAAADSAPNKVSGATRSCSLLYACAA
ncbi:hypothetical protein Anapl_06331 [Anas platyrhynchos]|uniref:Uncharacterized protein n=1 Tax=Anas platyrhynchos TaxID=8839 RepID=R0L270_ANAPL|nr:hypothetical protein Anapl_06331 [Anas platyrhynchos]